MSFDDLTSEKTKETFNGGKTDSVVFEVEEKQIDEKNLEETSGEKVDLTDGTTNKQVRRCSPHYEYRC